MQRSSVVGPDEATLLAALTNHTGSDDEAASILRSVERLGDDASIEAYEMTPGNVRRAYRDASPIVWTVRAVRR